MECSVSCLSLLGIWPSQDDQGSNAGACLGCLLHGQISKCGLLFSKIFDGLLLLAHAAPVLRLTHLIHVVCIVPSAPGVLHFAITAMTQHLQQEAQH